MRRTLKAVSFAAMASLTFAGCGLFGGGDSGGSSADDDDFTLPPSVGAESTVTMAGTLNLTTDTGAGLSLTQGGDSYELRCVTFQDEPAACAIPIGTDGSFNQVCEGFVGQPFGCFLRQGGSTLATIEFNTGEDTNSTMLAGNGVLQFDVIFDSETGKATAKVDLTASTSLAPEALAQFEEFLSANKTELADLTGTWAISCEVDDVQGFSCADGHGPEDGQVVELHQYLEGDKVMVSVWEPGGRNQCVVDGNESQPNFSVVIDGMAAPFPLDFSGLKPLQASFAQLYTQLPADVKQALDAKAAQRAEHEFGWCADQQESIFTADNCKLVAADVETHTYFNEQGDQVTETFPKFYEYSEFDSLTAFTGTAESAAVVCSYEGKNGLPYCPWFATENGDGTASFTKYSAAGKPLMLVCKEERQEWLMQEQAQGGTLADSITAMNGPGGGESECGTIEDGPFAGKLVGLRDITMRALMEVMNMDEERVQYACMHSQLPEGFSFAQCGSQDHDQPAVCWDAQWIRDAMSMKVGSDGRLVADGTPEWYDYGLGETVCPTAHAEFKQQQDEFWENPPADPVQGEEDPFDHHAMEREAAAACQAELAALNAGQQAARIQANQLKWQPVGEALVCAPDVPDAVKSKLVIAATNSCSPEVFLDHVCTEAGCQPALRCPGSSNGGACFNDDGTYAGRIPKRHAKMQLKLQVVGAFELTETVVDRWQAFDPNKNEPVECSYTNSMTMMSLTNNKAETDFVATWQSKETHDCPLSEFNPEENAQGSAEEFAGGEAYEGGAFPGEEMPPYPEDEFGGDPNGEIPGGDLPPDFALQDPGAAPPPGDGGGEHHDGDHMGGGEGQGGGGVMKIRMTRQ